MENKIKEQTQFLERMITYQAKYNFTNEQIEQAKIHLEELKSELRIIKEAQIIKETLFRISNNNFKVKPSDICVVIKNEQCRALIVEKYISELKKLKDIDASFYPNIKDLTIFLERY